MFVFIDVPCFINAFCSPYHNMFLCFVSNFMQFMYSYESRLTLIQYSNRYTSAIFVNIIVFLVWAVLEAVRLVLGYYGNLRERVFRFVMNEKNTLKSKSMFT